MAVMGINMVTSVTNSMNLRKGICRIAKTNPAVTLLITEIPSAVREKSNEFFSQARTIPF
jgi:hypothetical protein